ncbi:LuxR C-terminal-related transcriptional regulator [Paenibacillus hodogayensis]|uniref:LuxR C-terminal-related transcriptional regulator n=1 Tax=Paenibacillus hodogayensis TaxID=279208 RepID=A0ABV5VSA7_9BACL
MIISTKLRIPHVRKALVTRPALMRKLNEGMKSKLTLVSAQAGYGKTTLLSEWANQCGVFAAWVSLDQRDNDFTQFWGLVTASIQLGVPDFGKAVHNYLEKGPSVAMEHAIPALLNELNELTDEQVIVLDDFHCIELPAIHQSFIYFLDHLPPHIHLYLASRTDLTIPTARFLAKGDYQRIPTHELRFHLDEGIVFFRETADLLLTVEQVTELFHQTEGWISGLQLAAISLKRSENITETIRRFSGRQQHISDYLLEEVLQYQSESTFTFLLETSVLSRMNQSICQAVTGQENSQEQLEKLEKMNLFLIPLDDQREWYRYHQLLSDFLQHHLLQRDRGLWIRSHLRAANWLEDHGLDEEAIEHYLEGEQFADAVRLIEKHLHRLVQSRSVALHRWVSRLPDNAFAHKPMMEMFYISVLLGVGEWEAASRRVEQAAARFEAMQGTWGDTEWKRAMGNISFFCSIIAYLQKDLAKTSDDFERVEQYIPEGSFFQTMGRNRYQGYDLFDDHLAYINDLHAAQAFLEKWSSILGSKESYPFAGLVLASYSKLLYEWNRLEEAERYASQALQRRDLLPYARILQQVAFSASRIQQALGHADRASELLSQVKLQIDSPDYELFLLNIEAEQACLSLRQGSSEYAMDWLGRCGLSHTDEISMNRVQEYLAFARVLAVCERTENALHVLERLHRLLSKEDRLRDRIKVLVLHSVTLQRSGHTKAALVKLEAALQLAEPEGYIRSFIDEGGVMKELLSAYVNVQQGQAGLLGHTGHSFPVTPAYVKQLLQALQLVSAKEHAPKGRLTEQETNILLLIAEGLSNKEISRRLNIADETVKYHLKNVYRKLGVNNRVQAVQQSQKFT